MQTQNATSLSFNVAIVARNGGKKVHASSAYQSGTKVQATYEIAVMGRSYYRSAERLYDERSGKTYDFTRKEDVRFTDVWVPEQAPDHLGSRQTLWNAIEQIEKRKDAQLARDFTCALPRTLNMEQHISILREFCEQHFLSRNLIADIAIHNKQASDGGDNSHAHMLVTTRPVNPDGTFGNKDRTLNTKETLLQWRRSFQELCNRYLEDADSTQRVSLESFETRGIDRMPTVHLGHEAWQLESKGVKTRPGAINRTAYHVNHLRDLLQREGLDIRPVPESLPPSDRQNRRGLAELARPGDTGGDSSADHQRRVREMMQSLKAPVVQARLALTHKMNQFKTWWEERQRTRLPQEKQGDSVFDRHQTGNLGTFARLLHTEKDKDHER